MCESIYVLLNLDYDNKIVTVERKSFALNSDEAKEARKKEQKLKNFAKENNYKIYCDEEVVFDPGAGVTREQSNESENEKTMKIPTPEDEARHEREKQLYEQRVAPAREYEDYIQRKREERYEEMIDEAGEIESPMSRLHH